jgi:hypothetical protein
VTLDTITKPDLQLVTNEKKKEDAAGATTETSADTDDDAADEGGDEGGTKSFDAVRGEAINILADLVEFGHGIKAPATASARPAK